MLMIELVSKWETKPSISQERQQQNPNHQKRFLYLAHKIHNELQNGLKMSASAWACRPKPPLHGLNLNKSPIKKPCNIIKVK